MTARMMIDDNEYDREQMIDEEHLIRMMIDEEHLIRMMIDGVENDEK
jgi:hypothetical protein